MRDLHSKDWKCIQDRFEILNFLKSKPEINVD